MNAWTRGGLGVLVVLAAALQPALACRCVEPASTAQAYRSADVVVRARVQAVEGVGDAPGGARARLVVEESWKADVAGDLEVATSTTCAFDFQAGQHYLLFLFRDRQADRLTTRICAGNQPVPQAASALQWMRRHGRSSQRLPGQ